MDKQMVNDTLALYSDDREALEATIAQVQPRVEQYAQEIEDCNKDLEAANEALTRYDKTIEKLEREIEKGRETKGRKGLLLHPTKNPRSLLPLIHKLEERKYNRAEVEGIITETIGRIVDIEDKAKPDREYLDQLTYILECHEDGTFDKMDAELDALPKREKHIGTAEEQIKAQTGRDPGQYPRGTVLPDIVVGHEEDGTPITKKHPKDRSHERPIIYNTDLAKREAAMGRLETSEVVHEDGSKTVTSVGPVIGTWKVDREEPIS